MSFRAGLAPKKGGLEAPRHDSDREDPEEVHEEGNGDEDSESNMRKTEESEAKLIREG